MGITLGIVLAALVVALIGLGLLAKAMRSKD